MEVNRIWTLDRDRIGLGGGLHSTSSFDVLLLLSLVVVVVVVAAAAAAV